MYEHIRKLSTLTFEKPEQNKLSFVLVDGIYLLYNFNTKGVVATIVQV